MAIESRNPYSGELSKIFEEETEDQIIAKIDLAEQTYRHYKSFDFGQKKEWMLKTADLLRDRKDKYASLLTLEMGKPKREAISEIEKCALACEYYANHAEDFLADIKLDVEEGEAFIAHDPIGIVLAVMPWNFPFWQVFRFVAPNLMLGNVGLLKHASNVPQCALAIEEVLLDAGFPKGCFQTLIISSSKVNMILDDERIQGATLTGSEGAGSKVAERAGKNLKKTVLELGGSDPFIVLKDANVKEAAKVGAKARMINNGKSCIAAKRFILEKPIANEFLNYFEAEFQALRIGDPADDSVDYGPMAREDLAEELEEQVQKSVQAGAKIVFGGQRDGAFYEPTILSEVKAGMPAYEQELFGPVAVILLADDENHAIELANDSRFGLGGSLWSTKVEKAKALVRKVESGAVYINQLMASHPAVPFGGIKMSGYGRELSELGIKEFVNQKTIWVAS